MQDKLIFKPIDTIETIISDVVPNCTKVLSKISIVFYLQLFVHNLTC